MKIIYADDNFVLNNSVVILGNFDGVHSAHKMLIEKAVRIAKQNDYISVVYTFSEHPKKHLGSAVEILTTNSEKERLFESLGADVLVYQKPAREFLKLLPEEFFEKIIVNKLDAKHIVVGEHYTFGAKAQGTSNDLKNLAEQYGIDVRIEKLMETDSEIVSSSKIRSYLKQGDIVSANKMLGRYFSIEGEVVHGNHIGSEIGFPTANINFIDDKIVPKYGVYIGRAIIKGQRYNAVVNIGVKPTIGGNFPLLEAHLIGVKSDLYGEKITFELLDFVRDEGKFESLDALKKANFT